MSKFFHHVFISNTVNTISYRNTVRVAIENDGSSAFSIRDHKADMLISMLSADVPNNIGHHTNKTKDAR